MPLDRLKEGQDRISRRLTFLDSRIDASQIEYDQAKAHLEDCLALAGNAHAIYRPEHWPTASGQERG